MPMVLPVLSRAFRAVLSAPAPDVRSHAVSPPRAVTARPNKQCRRGSLSSALFTHVLPPSSAVALRPAVEDVPRLERASGPGMPLSS